MNAFTMKLESRHPIIPNQEKSNDVTGPKKCKSPKKRIYSSSTDKDALVIPVNNGLGRKLSTNSDFNDSNLKASTKPSCPKRDRLKKDCPKGNKMFTETEKMQEKLQSLLSTEDKEKILCILNDVKALSDIEKLYLYLQLPTGSPFDIDPFKQKLQNPLGKKADEEGMFAITWIQSHLEEDPDVSLPKQEVYDEYQAYCNLCGTDPLCAADFGKVMKQIFPSVKPRRLGTRGNSRYCYSGLRKKVKVEPPVLSDIQEESEKCMEETFGDEATAAASHLLLEWAEKLLGFHFTSLKELASHLLENMYVDSRSVAAFTLWLESSPQYLTKGLTSEGSVKKSEAQFQLQRKIQEKELIKEQKKKLQEQRNCIVSASKGKSISPKKKATKAKKTKLVSMETAEVECGKSSEILSKKPDENETTNDSPDNLNSAHAQAEARMLSELNIKEEECLIVCNSTENKSIVDSSLVSNIVVSPLSSPSSSTLGDGDDPNHATAKVFISQSSTPVCIAPTLPNIIIVPSLPQLTTQTTSTPKYKRIQPKPLYGEIFNSASRSRAGSVGSSLPSKPKARNSDGRRSSFAWLQSDSMQESVEEKSPKSNIDSFGAAFKSVLERNTSSKSISTLKDGVLYETPHSNLKNKSTPETSVHFPNGLNSLLLEKKKQSPESSNSPSCNQLISVVESEDNNSIKRHLEEKDDHADHKRVHLDPFKSTSPWVPGTCNVSKSLGTQLTSKLYTRISQEEVNVHEIEGDALNDYFQKGNNPVLQLSSSNKVQQLSQLRMLLEQNLPSAISKPAANPLKNQKLYKHIDLSDTIQVDMLKKSFMPILQEENKLLDTNNFFAGQGESCNMVKNEPQIDSLEGLLSSNCLVSDAKTHIDSELFTDPSMFLSCTQSNEQEIDVNLQSELNPNASNITLPSSLLTGAEMIVKQENAAILSGRISTCTQVPSVPQSPNTRRRAFNFMPISPRHTPVPDGVVPSPHMRTMASIGVGPSQPPSNSGSPFVSPRSTPVPLCRSRHSSGQSTYSTSRHTPFQNFDSGVSSVSSSPFISPQPTPVPVSRLRHNSSNGGSNKTVTFSSVHSPQVIHSSSSVPVLRTRHSSGPGATFSNNYSAHNSSLSPLVSESVSSFVFPPSNNEVRSRHNSGSNASMPLSPVSEHASSSSSCATNINDLTGVCDSTVMASQSFLNDDAGDLLISANPTSLKQVRHRHASSSVLYNKSYTTQNDIFSQEIQKLLKNYQENGSPDMVSNRSQSVPLHQMLQTAEGYSFLSQPIEDASTKSHPSTPVVNQIFSFPTNQTLTVDISGRDKSVISQMEWVALDGSELETSTARRNLAALYDAPPPLSDDLQTTLEDLRDCDTDFSKLEQELRQNEESAL